MYRTLLRAQHTDARLFVPLEPSGLPHIGCVEPHANAIPVSAVHEPAQGSTECAGVHRRPIGDRLSDPQEFSLRHPEVDGRLEARLRQLQFGWSYVVTRRRPWSAYQWSGYYRQATRDISNFKS
jgi:hypothetical protein